MDNIHVEWLVEVVKIILNLFGKCFIWSLWLGIACFKELCTTVECRDEKEGVVIINMKEEILEGIRKHSMKNK